jgi:phage tail sheath protein FI
MEHGNSQCGFPLQGQLLFERSSEETLMISSRETRPPGVYHTGGGARTITIGIASTHTAGFVGIANKGPLDIPVFLQSWTEFVELYGGSSEGHLARAVEGYFLNGGRACYVVRIARRPRDDEKLGPEHTAAAVRVIKDAWDKDTLRVSAINEGRWGNNIWVRFAENTGAKTLLTLDLPVGAGAARVTSTHGIERGALVRIYDRENSDYAIVTEVDEKEKTLRWGTDTPIVRRYAAAAPTYVEVLEFEIYASLRDRREVFRNLQISPLSRRYAPRVVNEQSQLIWVEDLGSSSPLPNNLPMPAPLERLSGGRDGIEGLTADDLIGYDRGMDDRRGLMTLAHVDDVGLILVPDAMVAYNYMSIPEARIFIQRVHDAMMDICEQTQDRFAILDLPETRDIEEIRRMRQRRNSQFAAYYFPWLVVPGNNGATHKQPPSGHIAGVYARSETQHGVHKAPANEQLFGVTQLTLPLSDDHVGQLNSEGINTIRSFTGRGIRIWGARTCAGEKDWRYINVRRLFIMLRRAIEVGTQWISFEPNTPETWAVIEREVSLFLGDLYTKGYFAGGSAEDSYLVKCDKETNPPEVVNVGRLVTEIRVAPALPAEFILFTIEQEMAERALRTQ